LNKAAEKQAITDATVASLEEEVQEGQDSIVVLLKKQEDKLALHKQDAQVEKKKFELALAESKQNLKAMEMASKKEAADMKAANDAKEAQEKARAKAELKATEMRLVKEAADMKAACDKKEAQLAQEGEDLHHQMAVEKAQAEAQLAAKQADAEATMEQNKERFEGEMKAQEVRLMKEAADMKAEHEMQAAEMQAAEIELNAKIKEAADFLAEQQAEAAKNAELIAENGIAMAEKVYQCMVPYPGVGYRDKPHFEYKSNASRGPHAPQCIIADALCQGANSTFVRCTSGKGWLPLANPTGTIVCLLCLGNVSVLDQVKNDYAANHPDAPEIEFLSTPRLSDGDKLV